MQFPPIDPVAFAIGPLVVRWYGLAYLAGVLLGVLYGALLLKRRTLWENNTPPFKTNDWFDFGFWAVVGIVIGGRLGYVLFYQPGYYLTNPLDIVRTWDGGMSFHGGALGLAVAMAIFTRLKGGNILSGFDMLAAVAPIGIMLGRMANFINGELYGRVTSLPWGIVFPGTDGQPRHPSQLYEAALEGLLLFLLLRYVTHIKYGLRRPGLVTGLFALGYAVSRLLVETVRLPDADKGYLFGGWLTYGMVLTAPMILIGLGFVLYANRKRRLV